MKWLNEFVIELEDMYNESNKLGESTTNHIMQGFYAGQSRGFEKVFELLLRYLKTYSFDTVQKPGRKEIVLNIHLSSDNHSSDTIGRKKSVYVSRKR